MFTNIKKSNIFILSCVINNIISNNNNQFSTNKHFNGIQIGNQIAFDRKVKKKHFLLKTDKKIF